MVIETYGARSRTVGLTAEFGAQQTAEFGAQQTAKFGAQQTAEFGRKRQ